MNERDRSGDSHDGFDRRSMLKATAVAAGGGAVGAGASGSAAAEEYYGPAVEAQVDEDVEKPTATRTFPKFEYRNGRYFHDGTRTWQTFKDTGNCCENYIATSPDGRIFDMGGDFLRVTADDGETWDEISIPGPLPVTSEGAVSAAPNGDICVMDWDPYSGDHTFAYKYDAADDTWYYSEMPVKTPFYDRPWLVVIPGPFEVAGEELPYIVVQRGGYPSDDELYVSFDGLNYFYASTRMVETAINGSVEEYLEFPPEDGEYADMIDWVQPHTETYINPLGGGRALADESVATADVAFFEVGADHAILGEASDAPGETGLAGELTWSEFDTPTGFEKTRTQTDSKGRIHQVEFPTPEAFEYRVSTDGGDTWARHRQPMPGGFELAPGLALYDFKVLTTEARNVDVDEDQVAIAVHGTFEPESEEGSAPEPSRRGESYPSREAVGTGAESGAGHRTNASEGGSGVDNPDIPADQDMLFRLTDVDTDGRDAEPRVELSFLGAADASYVSGVNTAERFDFQTLGVKPDGRVVMSFADTTDSDPMLAIELEEKPPVEELDRFVMPAGSREDDGTAFTGGQTDRIDLTVHPNVVPAEGATVGVRDVIPIEWDVVGGDVSEADVTEVEEAGVKRIDLGTAGGAETREVTYFVEAPSGPGATGEYSFGPAQIAFEGAWQDVEGTADTNAVAGPST